MFVPPATFAIESGGCKSMDQQGSRPAEDFVQVLQQELERRSGFSASQEPAKENQKLDEQMRRMSLTGLLPGIFETPLEKADPFVEVLVDDGKRVFVFVDFCFLRLSSSFGATSAYDAGW